MLLAQVVAAASTGLYGLGRKSLWFDEGFTFSVAHRPLGSLLTFVTHGESNMAPYYLAMHFWLDLGRSEATLRLLSVLFFVAAVPLLATVVDRTYGRRAGVVAGFLLAVNPFAVLYAQELRAYSMVMCGVVASTALLVECVLRPRRWVLVAFPVVTAVSFAAHYFAALVLVAQLVSLLWLPSPLAALRRMRWSLVATAVLCLPVAVFIVQHRNSPQIDWIPPLSLAGALAVLRAFVSGESRAPDWQLLLVGTLLVLAGVRTWRAKQHATRTVLGWGRALVWCWLVLPVGLTVALCAVQNLWVARYLVVVLPAFVALVAVGVVSLRPRALRTAAAGAVVVVSVVALASYYPSELRFGEDWRGAAHYLAADGVAGHAVLFAPGYLRFGSEYYPWADHLPPVDDAGLDGGPVDGRTASTAEVVRRLDASPDGRAFVVERGTGAPGVTPVLDAAGFRVVSAEHFGAVTVLRAERYR